MSFVWGHTLHWTWVLRQYLLRATCSYIHGPHNYVNLTASNLPNWSVPFLCAHSYNGTTVTEVWLSTLNERDHHTDSICSEFWTKLWVRWNPRDRQPARQNRQPDSQWDSQTVGCTCTVLCWMLPVSLGGRPPQWYHSIRDAVTLYAVPWRCDVVFRIEACLCFLNFFGDSKFCLKTI